MAEVQKEYEKLVTQGTYPTGATKTRAKQGMKEKQFAYEDIRIRTPNA